MRALDLSPPLEPRREAQGRSLAELVEPGRLVELCGEARTSAAASILSQIQRSGETSAWVQPGPGSLYAPDLADAGVDIEALVVVHVPPASPSRRGPGANASPQSGPRGPAGQCRAAELLLRSGAFGLVILDFAGAEPRGSDAWQGRLLGLARQHESRVLILRDASAAHPSLGPLIGLRVASHLEPAADEPGFVARTRRSWLVHEVLKNKSGGPLSPHRELLRGPWGLA
ncbi:hypothetical protein G6O69_25530 [Pseudenhygromyxa sp. WMMC2535]|uniref:hypothetical protein n=1 Tax=Pseudenhygromyxa sp. WMMC2535 TaxID=2712867 RepID=UPI001552DA2A|nr:hypothetical protein [Pseudenhygromyxa sp. WMMC2535]NVB41226.1 hypothetical protein [Pseudenhygromyxa sp. WMMC2535]